MHCFAEETSRCNLCAHASSPASETGVFSQAESLGESMEICMMEFSLLKLNFHVMLESVVNSYSEIVKTVFGNVLLEGRITLLAQPGKGLVSTVGKGFNMVSQKVECQALTPFSNKLVLPEAQQTVCSESALPVCCTAEKSPLFLGTLLM